MNERLLELAIEARKYAESRPAYQVAYDKKFAELIVRKCVSMCESVDEADIRYRYDYRRGVLDCADTLRQHFRVEE